MTKRTIWLLFVCLMPVMVLAQKEITAATPWQQYLDQLSDVEDFEDQSWEEYEDVLNELAEHPININTATTEDLQRLPFLTAQQIEDIEAYIYRYGAMKSLGELAMINGMSWALRQLLTCFVYVGEVKTRSFPSLRQIAKYGKHELMGMVKVPLYERKGDADGSYMGSRYKHWLRYQFRYSDKVKMGFTGSKDAGEPFMSKGNGAGYDFYSFYLQIRGWGRLKNLTLGRYRLHEGLGLILNNDFSFGKLSTLSALGRNSNVIRAHSSRYAANYLQGAAATVTVVRGLDVTGFVSYRKIDATLKDGGIQTILTSGLHRTASEMAKKDVASAFLAGGNVSYRRGRSACGSHRFLQLFLAAPHAQPQVVVQTFCACRECILECECRLFLRFAPACGARRDGNRLVWGRGHSQRHELRLLQPLLVGSSSALLSLSLLFALRPFLCRRNQCAGRKWRVSGRQLDAYRQMERDGLH